MCEKLFSFVRAMLKLWSAREGRVLTVDRINTGTMAGVNLK